MTPSALGQRDFARGLPFYGTKGDFNFTPIRFNKAPSTDSINNDTSVFGSEPESPNPSGVTFALPNKQYSLSEAVLKYIIFA